jgi:hypothetical protein
MTYCFCYKASLEQMAFQQQVTKTIKILINPSLKADFTRLKKKMLF